MWDNIIIARSAPAEAKAVEHVTRLSGSSPIGCGSARVKMRAVCLLLLLLPAPALAVSFEFPGSAVTTAVRNEALGSYALPVGPWSGGAIKTLPVEGAVEQTAWKVQIGALTTLQLLKPLRNQLRLDGFTTLYECDATSCGGFDFRYETNVLPEPEMHVDLGDFRYLAASRDTDGGPEYVSLLVSRSSESGFVQVIRVGGAEAPLMVLTPSTKSPDTLPLVGGDQGVLSSAGQPAAQSFTVGPLATEFKKDLALALESGGAVPLEDLAFEIGSAELAPGDFASLDALADYLKTHPQRHVMLVGHTDASGSLDANIALSKRRAASVVARLVDVLGVAKGQLASDGVGFLVPRASNLTEEGRTENRRVEAVLTSTQ